MELGQPVLELELSLRAVRRGEPPLTLEALQLACRGARDHGGGRPGLAAVVRARAAQHEAAGAAADLADDPLEPHVVGCAIRAIAHDDLGRGIAFDLAGVLSRYAG